MSHYYINGSRTGDGKCYDEFDDARTELLRMIAKKLDGANAYQARAVGRGMGEVANWSGWYDEDTDNVIVGSDTWRIMTCTRYGCTDSIDGDW